MTLTCSSFPLSSSGLPYLGPRLIVTGPKAILAKGNPQPADPKGVPHLRGKGGVGGWRFSPQVSWAPWEAVPPTSSLQTAIKSQLFEDSLKTSENSCNKSEKWDAGFPQQCVPSF